MNYTIFMEDTIEKLATYSPQSYEVLPLEIFKVMDNVALEHGIEIELMMELAGYQLARLVYNQVAPASVVIGIGPGNNGGGGLVAARKLQGWGIDVSLHVVNHNGNQLFHEQLERALRVGVSSSPDWEADAFIDAYLGFSQYRPLDPSFKTALQHVDQLLCKKISLDLPTGFLEEGPLFTPDAILSLAAPKTDLVSMLQTSDIYIADIGIPFKIYRMFGYKEPIPFFDEGIVQWVAQETSM